MDMIGLPGRAVVALFYLCVGGGVGLLLLAIPWLVVWRASRGRYGRLAKSRGILPALICTLISLCALWLLSIENWRWIVLTVVGSSLSGAMWCKFRTWNRDPQAVSIFDWPPKFSMRTLGVLGAFALAAAAAIYFRYPWRIDQVINYSQNSCQRMVLAADDRMAYVCASFSTNVEAVDLTTGALSGIQYDHKARINALAVSPNGELLATGGDDSRVLIWRTKSGRIVNEFLRHTDKVGTLAFSPDGQSILSIGLDGARIWDVHTGVQHKTFERIRCGSMHPHAHFSNDGKLLAVVERQRENEFVRVRFADSGEVLLEVPGARQSHLAAAYSPDDKKLVVLESGFRENSKLTIVDIAQDTRKEFELAAGGPPASAALSPDQKEILAVHTERFAILYDAATGAEKYRLPLYSITNAQFTSDGNRVVVSDYGGKLTIFKRVGSEMERTILWYVLGALGFAIVVSLFFDARRLRIAHR